MGRIIRHIPNAVTCCNLLSGCLSIAFSTSGKIDYAVMMIFAAAVFDFCDGLSARLLKAFSSIGGELDSLSDVVSFGVAPSFIVYEMFSGAFVGEIAFLLAAFAAVRLATFNIDTEQKTSFLGLPTPPMAIFVASLPMTAAAYQGTWIENVIMNDWFLLAVVIVFSVLMVTRIPFFSLKVKNMKWSDNKLRYIYIILSVALVAVFGWLGLTMAILLYIGLSLCCGKK